MLVFIQMLAGCYIAMNALVMVFLIHGKALLWILTRHAACVINSMCRFVFRIHGKKQFLTGVLVFAVGMLYNIRTDSSFVPSCR